MFPDLMLFAEQLVTTFETSGRTPSTVVFLGVEFTLRLARNAKEPYTSLSVATIETL